MTHPFPLFEPIWIPSREVLVTPIMRAGAQVPRAREYWLQT
jgi:hypothetical protein